MGTGARVGRITVREAIRGNWEITGEPWGSKTGVLHKNKMEKLCKTRENGAGSGKI